VRVGREAPQPRRRIVADRAVRIAERIDDTLDRVGGIAWRFISALMSRRPASQWSETISQMAWAVRKRGSFAPAPELGLARTAVAVVDRVLAVSR